MTVVENRMRAVCGAVVALHAAGVRRPKSWQVAEMLGWRGAAEARASMTLARRRGWLTFSASRGGWQITPTWSVRRWHG